MVDKSDMNDMISLTSYSLKEQRSFLLMSWHIGFGSGVGECGLFLELRNEKEICVVILANAPDPHQYHGTQPVGRSMMQKGCKNETKTSSSGPWPSFRILSGSPS